MAERSSRTRVSRGTYREDSDSDIDGDDTRPLPMLKRPRLQWKSTTKKTVTQTREVYVGEPVTEDEDYEPTEGNDNVDDDATLALSEAALPAPPSPSPAPAPVPMPAPAPEPVPAPVPPAAKADDELSSTRGDDVVPERSHVQQRILGFALCNGVMCARVETRTLFSHERENWSIEWRALTDMFDGLINFALDCMTPRFREEFVRFLVAPSKGTLSWSSKWRHV